MHKPRHTGKVSFFTLQSGRADLAFGVFPCEGRPGDVGYGFGVAGFDEGEGLPFGKSCQDVDVLVIERAVLAAQAFLVELIQQRFSCCASHVAAGGPGESDVVGCCQTAGLRAQDRQFSRGLPVVQAAEVEGFEGDLSQGAWTSFAGRGIYCGRFQLGPACDAGR